MELGAEVPHEADAVVALGAEVGGRGVRRVARVAQAEHRQQVLENAADGRVREGSPLVGLKRGLEHGLVEAEEVVQIDPHVPAGGVDQRHRHCSVAVDLHLDLALEQPRLALAAAVSPAVADHRSSRTSRCTSALEQMYERADGSPKRLGANTHLFG